MKKDIVTCMCVLNFQNGVLSSIKRWRIVFLFFSKDGKSPILATELMVIDGWRHRRKSSRFGKTQLKYIMHSSLNRIIIQTHCCISLSFSYHIGFYTTADEHDERNGLLHNCTNKTRYAMSKREKKQDKNNQICWKIPQFPLIFIICCKKCVFGALEII